MHVDLCDPIEYTRSITTCKASRGRRGWHWIHSGRVALLTLRLFSRRPSSKYQRENVMSIQTKQGSALKAP